MVAATVITFQHLQHWLKIVSPQVTYNMNNYARTRALHQFYRDVFTRTISLPEADVLPAHLVVEILNYANADFESLEAKLWDAETDLDTDNDRALKLMMCAI